MASRANQDFHSIRCDQKLAEDVSQMLITDGLDLDEYTSKYNYNRTSKGNIPKYNIKCTKTKDLQPFMSPKHYQDIKLSRGSTPKGTSKKIDTDKAKKHAEAEEEKERQNRFLQEASAGTIS